MKVWLINGVIVWFLFISAISLNADPQHELSAAGSISPDPKETIVDPGDDLWIEITVGDVQSLFGLSFVLSYNNKGLIEPLSCETGYFLGYDALFLSQVDKNTDEVSVGISRKAGQGGVSGSGVVALIKVRISSEALSGTTITFSLSDITANTQTGIQISLSSQKSTMKVRLKGGAESFNPIPLIISAPSLLIYDFDGSVLEIPVTVNGTPANTTLLIYTKDHASGIGRVKNGFLGWHYINNIDTCIYTSSPYMLDVGSNTIKWDGNDNDGKTVSTSEYSYYLWAYDPISLKKPVARNIDFNRGGGTFITHDEIGNAFPNPLFFNTPNTYHTESTQTSITRQKWLIGNNPDDVSLQETTTYHGWIDRGTIAIDPYDQSDFYVSIYHPEGYKVIRKYRWIPNGKSQLHTNWGIDGETWFNSNLSLPDILDPGVVYAGNGILMAVNCFGYGRPTRVQRAAVYNYTRSELVLLDILNGNEVRRIDLSDWWVDYDDAEAGGLLIGGPTTMETRDKLVALGSHASCVLQFINPHHESDDDIVIFTNNNGDYVGDKNFEEDSDRPWVCNDNLRGIYAYNLGVDSHHFVTFPAYDNGAVSLGALGPDGTGLGYFAYAGETAEMKYGTKVIDYGSAYDGMYMDNRSSDSDNDREGLWYIAHDSFKGTIGCCYMRAKTVHFSHHFNENSNKATIIIRNTPSIFGKRIEQWDEFAVFSPDGICRGAAKWGERNQQSITVYGDNPATENIDGMREGEPFTFRLWIQETDTEYETDVIFSSIGTTYRDGAVIGVESIFVKDTERYEDITIPSEFTLSQNYPNPFNPVTTISFSLPQDCRVVLKIYNSAGETVTTLADNYFSAGKHSVAWDAKGYSSGIYLYRLEAGDFVETKKLMLLK